MLEMNDVKCINQMLAFLLVLCIQYVGSEENKNPKKILIVTQKKTEIENHTRQNVFNENINTRSSLTCNSNEWICDGKCIHKREYCVENSQCHPTYPIPCGDKVRCYRKKDDCWNTGCLNRNCFDEVGHTKNEFSWAEPMVFGEKDLIEDLLKGTFLNHLDKRQTKFLQQCPEVENRLDPCFYTSFGDLCFYPDEWVCNNKCISKHNVCRSRNPSNNTKSYINKTPLMGNDATCHWGLKRCGKNKCVSRYTPCEGKCWNEANPIPCGSNLCLNENQIRDHHVCNGKCYDYTVPCNNTCQHTNYYLCDSWDQCYRYWDHCDKVMHCDDGSDEGSACKLRELIVYLVPMLMLTLISTLICILCVLKIRGFQLNQNEEEMDRIRRANDDNDILGGERMTQLFSYPISYDNDNLPYNNFGTEHTCSEESFSAHPQCVIDCNFCNQNLKPPLNCIKHNNLKNILKFEQESIGSSVKKVEIANNIGNSSNKAMTLMKTARSITPTLHQVKVKPDPKGMPLLNNLRSLASATTNKVANQINLPQDKNLEDCKRNHVSNGSAIRSKETEETSMHHNRYSKVADLKKPQQESQNITLTNIIPSGNSDYLQQRQIAQFNQKKLRENFFLDNGKSSEELSSDKPTKFVA